MNTLNYEDKVLAAGAYAFFIPSLYVILTKKRRNKLLAFHAAQALFLWIGILLAFIFLRLILNLIWALAYLPFLEWLANLVRLLILSYALYCGSRVFLEEKYRIPLLNVPAEGLS
ncbi:hypothetical protein HZC35_01615 [Candidatus Saganbacteria bacterium]|nr:hypothetical protein [Candidatus Saganbacteria bacterium]